MSLQTIAAAAYLVIQRGRRRKRPKWWRRELFVAANEDHSAFFDKLLADDEAHFRNFTRMSRDDFDLLLGKVGQAIEKCDTNFREAIPAKVRFTLRFLATGDSYVSLMYLFRISEPSISRIIPEVCKAVIDALKDVVKYPTTEVEWKRISQYFDTSWNYPHCIGACDGKHIVIQCPKNSGSVFFNYKGTFSIVLMAICDATYTFQYANIGCQGRISDGGVFRETDFYQKLSDNRLSLPQPEPLPGRVKTSPYVLLTDEAFPLQENIMKPYTGHYDKGSPERIYNYRPSLARRIIENSFGHLASVFRVFRKPMAISVENAVTVTTTCIYLHNFLRRSSTSKQIYSPQGSFDMDTQDGSIIPGSWREVIQADTGMAPLVNKPRKSSEEAKAVRDDFRQFFVSEEGRVPWQDHYA